MIVLVFKMVFGVSFIVILLLGKEREIRKAKNTFLTSNAF